VFRKRFRPLLGCPSVLDENLPIVVVPTDFYDDAGAT
jgi:hypothetical protein